jgi:hypothetical protein
MDWYYAVAGNKKGPVTPAEFNRLVQQGVVTAETLVWRVGMPAWQPYAGETRAAHPAAAAPPPIGVTCAGCGRNFPQSDVIPLAGRIYCAACKPMAVQRLAEGVTANSDVEAIRNEFLKHEASVKSIGLLYYLGAGFTFLIGLGAALGGAARSDAGGASVSFFFFALGAGQFWLGHGLRKLKRWARIPTAILSGIGLLAVPIGTLINGYILYLIFSAKGKMVFSDEYREVMEQTPHIKYRTSLLVWILFALVLGFLAFVLIAAVFGQR